MIDFKQLGRIMTYKSHKFIHKGANHVTNSIGIRSMPVWSGKSQSRGRLSPRTRLPLRICRRWSAGPFLAVDCGQQVNFEGEDQVRVFHSSEWAQRGFCSQCGTHLFYRLIANGQYIMPADLFDDLGDIQFKGQIFIDKKPEYYEFANQTDMKTAEEVIAEFLLSNND